GGTKVGPALVPPSPNLGPERGTEGGSPPLKGGAPCPVPCSGNLPRSNRHPGAAGSVPGSDPAGGRPSSTDEIVMSAVVGGAHPCSPPPTPCPRSSSPPTSSATVEPPPRAPSWSSARRRPIGW